MTQPAYRLLGANPSPYSMKLRAILRYRRLPFVWEASSPRLADAFREVRPAVIPVLQYPDGHYANDTTPLAYDLERRHPGERSIIPDDPAAAFLSDLLEDMSDEWGTKCMFHYRWWYAADREFASLWVVGDRYAARAGVPAGAVLSANADPRSNAEVIAGPADVPLQQAMRQFHDRQVARTPLVGVTAGNRPVVEETYRRVLAAFERGLSAQPFLFGTRPSLADFGWFGQLTILSVDPTPGWLMRLSAPRLLPWLLRMDDASGVEGAWASAGAVATPFVMELLRLAGESYLPFMRANAHAVEENREQVALSIFGMPYLQTPFRYQQKCFRILRERYAGLSAGVRERLVPTLRDTGCLAHLE